MLDDRVDDVVAGAVPRPDRGPRDLRRAADRHRRGVRPQRRRRRRRRHGDGHRPVAVGERHAALRVDPRRDPLRRRHVPAVLLRGRPTSRSTTRGTRRGCAARGRWTSPSTGPSCRWRRTIQPFASRPTLDVPLAWFPNFSLLAACVSAVSLGIAPAGVDELGAMAGGKRPQFSSRTLAESPFTQIELARAEAALRSARAFLHDEVGRAWDEVLCRRARSTSPSRVGIRLAAVNAVAARRPRSPTSAFTLAGGSSVYSRQRPAALPARRPHPDPAPPGRPQALRDARPRPPRPGHRRHDPLTRVPAARVLLRSPAVHSGGQTPGQGPGPRGCGRPEGVSSGGTTRPISGRPAAA